MSTSVPKPARARGAGSALGWALTIVCNVVAPIVTYNQLTDAGWSEFTALLVSGLWPLLDIAVHLVWRRTVDEFAMISLAFLVLTGLVTLVGPHSARLMLVKDSAVTGLFGLLCLATLAAPRPLMFYFGRKFATDGSPESHAWWNGMWQFEGFRTTMRTITVAWGVGYLVEAGVRIGLSYALSTGAMVTVNSVLSYGVMGLLVVWTIWYSKRAQARGQARAAAAEAEALQAATENQPLSGTPERA
ncbi:VC0807 family protein [Streptomyces palmae]|uniref:VC0807 family protein n=1 Tax=Streptomyces palmae TaxID=1701085 RepID=UPI001FD80EF7|nr:VC0807 family protein [Streptomyces palmae]